MTDDERIALVAIGLGLIAGGYKLLNAELGQVGSAPMRSRLSESLRPSGRTHATMSGRR